MKRRAVFLDRDGVINQATVRDGRPYPPESLDKVLILPGVAEGLLRLRAAGFVLLVLTNQPDVARGKTTRETVEEIHDFLLTSLPLDDVFTCYHDDADNCVCRKPFPGLLYQAADQYAVALPQSFMIGDRWRDIEAGQAAGCKTVFIDYRYMEKRPDHFDFQAASLFEAVEWILQQQKGANDDRQFKCKDFC